MQTSPVYTSRAAMTGALRRLPAASVCSMLLGAARRTLPATVVAASVEHMARRGAGLASLQASRVCSLSTAAARSLATTPDRGWMSLHASVERRMMSSTAPEKSAASDGSDLDPYLPHRVNFENAKAYIKANVAKGMSHEEVAVIVKKAMELHIPPVPSLEVRSLLHVTVPGALPGAPAHHLPAIRHSAIPCSRILRDTS